MSRSSGPRLLLVAPEPGKRGQIRWKGARKTAFPPLSLLTVAASTPAHFQVRVVDESLEELDLDAEVDLVALTANTASAPRAYELAAQFHRRGRTVVMGGIHATALPEEAAAHVDAVGAGEAEGFWPRLLADFEAGCLQPVYHNEELPSLEGLPFPRRDLVNLRRYWVPYTIQTSRGCPFRCTFCSVHRFFGGHYRMRPVPEVVEELKTFGPKKRVVFVDDNIFGNRARAEELMEGMIGLQHEWFGQASMDKLQDEAFLRLASRAGCRLLFVGLESLSNENLRDINKGHNRPERMREMVERVHRHGIGILGAFIVGLEHDTPEVFDRILAFAEEVKLDAIQVALLIPIPGTDEAERLAPRVFDHDYGHRDGTRMVFRHDHLTPPILAERKLEWTYSQLYSRQGIRKRLGGQSGPHLRHVRLLNYAYRLGTNRWIRRLTGR